MARFCERRGRIEEAERYYKGMAEQYDDEEYLRAFYVRSDLSAPGGRFRAEAEAARKALFREGIAHVALRD